MSLAFFLFFIFIQIQDVDRGNYVCLRMFSLSNMRLTDGSMQDLIRILTYFEK